MTAEDRAFHAQTYLSKAVEQLQLLHAGALSAEAADLFRVYLRQADEAITAASALTRLESS